MPSPWHYRAMVEAGTEECNVNKDCPAGKFCDLHTCRACLHAGAACHYIGKKTLCNIDVLDYFRLSESFIFKEPAVRDMPANMASAPRERRKESPVRIATGLRIVSAKNRAVFGKFPSIHTRPCASQC